MSCATVNCDALRRSPLQRAMAARSRSLVFTEFASDCFWIVSAIELSPFSRLRVIFSRVPSTTVAMSRR